MKTLKKDNRFLRERDDRAADLVNNAGWMYCSKQDWKVSKRDVDKKDKKE